MIMFDRIKDLLDPPITQHRIFFFHIAKCGGTSISQAIEAAYKPWRPGRAQAVFRLNEGAARFADESCIGSGNDVRRDLLNYALSLPEAKCVLGHFHFSNIAFEKYSGSWQFVTVLRNPIDRWLSHYSYNLGSTSKYSIDMDLEEFVATERAASFGRAFVDEVTDDIDKTGLPMDALIDMAVARFNRFSIVGTIENTVDFAKRFEEKFGHRLQIKHLNETPTTKRVETRSISGELLQRISKLCAPDISLYERVIGAPLRQQAGSI